MAAESTGKISPELEKRLRSVPADEPIEVIVHLEPPHIPLEGSRAERIGATKKTFERHMQQVVGSIGPDGGEVLETAWINSTALVRATPDQIKDLESQPQVEGIATPVTLQPD
jgi:hypothetical protein